MTPEIMPTPRSILKAIPLRRPMPVPRSRISHLTSTQTRAGSNTVKRDIEDKKSAQQNLQGIDRQSQEYALSGTDDAVASQGNVSFDPTQSTDPAHAKDMAGKDSSDHNPLDVSAANPEVSSAAREGGYSRKEKESVTYASPGSGKSKQQTVPENKAYAGSDSRRPDRPQDVRTGQITPGSR
ncbi:hypothetical protein OHC33_006995 [Knufia fluminis]|uniref:Uncharacterized protein n=1 Tax=Knufia fluminis TaxID=191047 RepID=A0AAN8EU40_9EURO|nr:hypothetical protein OHC33_006995 [Knufia fluminis]